MTLPTGLLSHTLGANTDRPDAPHRRRLLRSLYQEQGESADRYAQGIGRQFLTHLHSPGSEQQDRGNLPTSRRTNRFCGAAQNESPSSVSQGLDSMFNVTAASELVPADWKDDIAALFVGFDDLLHAPARRRCLLRQGKPSLAGA